MGHEDLPKEDFGHWEFQIEKHRNPVRLRRMSRELSRCVVTDNAGGRERGLGSDDALAVWNELYVASVSNSRNSEGIASGTYERYWQNEQHGGIK